VLESGSVFRQDSIKATYLQWQGCTRKTEEDDTGVWKPVTENEFAEVVVGDEEYSVLVPGDCKDVIIGQPDG
jgi:hypothetical protein